MVQADTVLVHDGRFEYRTGGFAARSVCRLRVYESWAGTILLASELADNPGPSITNSAEALATALAERYRLDAGHAVFIEHYDQASYRGLPREPTYDAVSFTWAGGRATAPRWKRLGGADLDALGLPDKLGPRP